MYRNLRWLVAALAGTVALGLGVAPAAAATSSGTADRVRHGNASATFERLILAPTARGYEGTLPVTIHNGGTEASYFRLLFREPVAGSFKQTTPQQFCQTVVGDTGDRSTYECFLDRIAPGGDLTVHFTFRALTATKPYPMRADGGRIAISDSTSLDAPRSTYRGFTTLFRSTRGALHPARTYQQDQHADARLTVAGEVRLTRQPNGWYTGTLPVTVRHGTDAAHWGLRVGVTVTDDRATLVGTEPSEVPCYYTCDAPGDLFMEGEERSFDLLFEAPPDAVPGTVEATATLTTYWRYDEVTERTPADNTATFRVTIAP
ncbi:hypothetical protein [Phytohabitans rumicis]|uniref:Uncharacterized protein n=1 Tax=Phytohabitans rumicis TaxID=1076125 RepID=A0A6V8LH62_9ACTN|nr:hypothetical protein [Phytohabitans rumicis]GFJ94248.1 hypothetical protein Prum_078900 [Phytohabitans rumicis]